MHLLLGDLLGLGSTRARQGYLALFSPADALRYCGDRETNCTEDQDRKDDPASQHEGKQPSKYQDQNYDNARDLTGLIISNKSPQLVPNLPSL